MLSNCLLQPVSYSAHQWSVRSLLKWADDGLHSNPGTWRAPEEEVERVDLHGGDDLPEPVHLGLESGSL